MCGINGLVNIQRQTERSVQKGLKDIEAMNCAIAYRGPDDVGIYQEASETVFLGHRRLSIIDTSICGHQPMVSSNGRYWMVFNGEVYNYKDIKAVLSTSVRFKSGTDTEVILECLSERGIQETLDLLSGMFAIAVYDREKEVLYLARDRVGEKPLYYGEINDCFFFSSEIRAIESVFKTTLTISKKNIQDYLDYGYVPGTGTPYQEVRKLEPGTFLRLDCRSGEQTSHRFTRQVTSGSKNVTSNSITYEQVLTRFDQILNEVIEEQRVADVALGCFLSGGIDSSLVASILAKQSAQPVEAFTIGFHEKQFDESQKAKEVAEHLGLSHNIVTVSEEQLLAMASDTIIHFDEPFANPSSIVASALAEFARRKVTVCLSGDGGDELFLGYNRYVKAKRAMDISKRIPKLLKMPVSAAIHGASKLPTDQFLDFISERSGLRLGVNYSSKFTKLKDIVEIESAEALYKKLVSYSDSNAVGRGNDQLFNGQNYFFDEDFTSSAAKWDIDHYLPGDCLYKTDRAAMAHSLEVRIPLLDRRILEFSNSVPEKYKLNKGIEKAILKDTLKRYVPEKLFLRPKMGFTVPIGKWIQGSLHSEISEYLNEVNIKKVGILDYSVTRVLLEKSMNNEQKYFNSLWACFVFQKWMISRLDSA